MEPNNAKVFHIKKPFWTLLTIWSPMLKCTIALFSSTILTNNNDLPLLYPLILTIKPKDEQGAAEWGLSARTAKQ